MSWWDTAGITNLASQALKNAQSKIDQALDIKESEKKKKDAAQKKPPSEKLDDKSQGDGVQAQSGDFWSGWGTGAEGDKTTESSSSWGLPWGKGGSEESSTAAQKSKVSESSKGRKKTRRKSSADESKAGADLKSKVADVFDIVKSTGQGLLSNSENNDVSTKETEKTEDFSIGDTNSGWQDFPMDQDDNNLLGDERVIDTAKHSDNDDCVQNDFEDSGPTNVSTISASSDKKCIMSDESNIVSEAKNTLICEDLKSEDTIENKNVTEENLDIPELVASQGNSTDADIVSKEYTTEDLSSPESQMVQDSDCTVVNKEIEDGIPIDSSQEFINISSCGSDAPQTLLSESGSDIDFAPPNSDLDLPSSRTSSDLEGTGSSDTSKFDSSVETVVDRSNVDIESGSEEIVPSEDGSYSLFGVEAKKEELDKSSTSISSSYVKCMIEEAMEDSKTDSGSDNHSNGEKSESSKVDSEMEKSLYSGDGSSDDVETTTSSDIEILQAPASGDEIKYHTTFDLSPLKIALQKSAGGHSRSDSQSSSSGFSKAGETEQSSPDRGEGTDWREEDYPHLQSVQEEGGDNPYHPEKLLKKLADMAEVLQAREEKLVLLSKENHTLLEDSTILRNQLQQSEEAREAETADLNTLTNEFTNRIGEQEKKIQAVMKEKEALKLKLNQAESLLSQRSANTDVEALLEEKTEQVEELLAEGEKLSKQQLQSNNIIKKLRAKEKETDATITTQKKKLEEQTKELDRLAVVLESKEEMENKQAEAIDQLNTHVQKQEKELVKLRSESEDFTEKTRGLQTALDNSYKEIAELHRSNASQDSKAQEAALSAQTLVREELKTEMEREKQRFKQEREAFIMQADDLRLDMARLEKEHSRREELLRQEISHLQQRLQEDESRSQELSQSVTLSTRPLLRQIENLQATHGAQSLAWERVEKSLTDRLAEAQTALAMAQEKERMSGERQMELQARVTSLEALTTRLKGEKATLATQVESDRIQLEEVSDARSSLVAQLEASKQRLTQEVQQLKVDKVHLDSQLGIEKTKLETEMKRSQMLEDQMKVMSVSSERPKSQGSRGTPSPSISRQDSLAGSMYESQSSAWGWSLNDDLDSSSPQPLGRSSSVYDSMRFSGAAVVMENMQSQVKQREGEITQLHSEIQSLERTRESMARELVNLSNQNDDLTEDKKAHDKLRGEFEALNSRYSALLLMYGEKEEQVQELRLDLQDVKEMYKSQIDTLLAK